MDSVIPKNVEAQAKAAEDLQRQLVGDKGITPDARKDIIPSDQPIVPEKPIDPATPATVEPAKKTYQQLEEELKTLEASSMDWENKYKSLHGKTAKEMPFLQKQNTQLTLSIEHIQNANKQLQTENATLRAQIDQAAAKPGKAIDPQAFTEYGPEFVSLAETLKAVVEGVKKPPEMTIQTQAIQPAQTMTGQNQQAKESLYNRVKARVDQGVIKFDRVNWDPEFTDVFLNEVDPTTGMLKRDKMAAAFERFDEDGVVAVFNEFIASGRMTPLPSQVKETPPAAPRSKGNLSITPDSGVRTQIVAPSQVTGERYTEAAVKQFFKDVALNKWPGQQAWVDAKMADIQKAAIDGRIDK